MRTQPGLGRGFILFTLILIWPPIARSQSSEARQSASRSVKYLSARMDRFHNRFPVYDDLSSPGNHFHTWAKIGDNPDAVDMRGGWTTDSYEGATAIRCEYRPISAFAGFYMLNGVLPDGASAPVANFGTVPNAGIDLSGSVRLSGWIRGERGGERVELFVAGVGRDAQSGAPTAPYPDSSPRQPPLGAVRLLTSEWSRFEIDLSGLDLSYVLGALGWVCSAANNPGGAVFYLDDLQFEFGSARLEQRLNEPRFVVSYDTLNVQQLPDPVGDFDFRFRPVAFLYDQAMAINAFLADGGADGLRRARLIGDAIVYASSHDRQFDDGRLRTAYAGGDLALPPGWTPHGRVATAAIPGVFDEASQSFIEVEQEATDTGNNAWAMIALLNLYDRTAEPAYLACAIRAGEFVRGFRNDLGLYRGFQGGLDAPESVQPLRRTYASTEHNLDLFAAMSRLYAATGSTQWSDDADHALAFVLAMWDESRRCFLAGTTDPDHRNSELGRLPVDVQAWSILSLRERLGRDAAIVLDSAERNHRTVHDGLDGFDFNDDRDGVWPEGTAHVAVAYSISSVCDAAERLRQTLRQAQQPAGGTIAACHDGLTTGFNFFFHRRQHVGATAWNACAQLEYNPFYGTRAEHGQLVLGVDSARVGEKDPVAEIPVFRQGGSHGAVAVSISVRGRSAVQGEDFTGGPFTLTWADGDSQPQMVRIAIVDDARSESDESIEVELADPTCGAGIGEPNRIVLTIADDEPPDADGDGTSDADDGCPNDAAKTEPGVCGCGVADVDTDGDGVADCNDGCPNDPAKSAPGACDSDAAETDAGGAVDGGEPVTPNSEPPSTDNDPGSDSLGGGGSICPVVAVVMLFATLAGIRLTARGTSR